MDRSSGSDIPVKVKVMFPKGVPEDHWLMEDRFELFRKGYSYATTQTMAIEGLAKLDAVDVFEVYEAIARGIAYARGEVYRPSYSDE